MRATMYLVHCDLYDEPYSTDYTLMGVFFSKKEAYDFMDSYNKKVADFKDKNASLLKRLEYDPVNDPQFEEYVISYGESDKSWDQEKLEKVKDIEKKIDAALEEIGKCKAEAIKRAKEENIAYYYSCYDEEFKLFEFDLSDKDSYIDEFNGKPKSICCYSE